MGRRAALICLIGTLIWTGCATYEPKVAPFKLPEAHANVQRIGGAYVASRAWPQEVEAKEAFGFNIIQAGLLPVQVSFDNRGSETLVIEPSQTYLINQQQDLFPVLSDEEAYDREPGQQTPGNGERGHPGSAPGRGYRSFNRGRGGRRGGPGRRGRGGQRRGGRRGRGGYPGRGVGFF